MKLARPTVLLVALLVASGAAAQPASDPGAAEALFQKARTLMEQGKLVEACPIFDESYRLDPAPGTLLNLAACSRHKGKTATSWGQFVEAGRAFRRKGDERRALFAEGQAKELEPMLAHVVLSAEAPPPGLSITRDGVELSAASLGLKLPVDPGRHELVLRAPGHKSRTQTFDAEARKTVELVLDPLSPGEDEPKIEAPTPAPPGVDPGPADRRGPNQRLAGFIVGGVGLASLAVGAVFVGLTAQRSGELDDLCPAQRCTTAEAKDALSEANIFANVANGMLIAGGVVAAAGLVVVLTAPSSDPDVVRVQIGPALGGLSVSGSFR